MLFVLHLDIELIFLFATITDGEADVEHAPVYHIPEPNPVGMSSLSLHAEFNSHSLELLVLP